MKVLIITTVRFRFNGITSVILNYYLNMNKKGMQIDLVTPNKISEEYKNIFSENSSKVFNINRKGNPLKYFIHLTKLLKKEKYDVVHIHGNSSMMLIDVLPAVIARVPIRIVHSHNTTCNHVWLHRLLNPLFNLCYTNGMACGQDAGRWLYGSKSFVELKNGIDTSKYLYSESIREQYRKELGVGEKVLLGHVGNFIEQKNHEFLIDIFADLLKKNSNYMLLLISDGALMESIKAKVERLKISDSVIFLGKTPDVNKYMQAMDILLLPSLYEGLPVVLIEAQSAGLQCLVSDKVSVESDVTDTLKFIAIDDTEQWVNEIQKSSATLKNSDRYQICLENDKKISQSGYDVTQNAEFLKKYYIDLVKGKKK